MKELQKFLNFCGNFRTLTVFALHNVDCFDILRLLTPFFHSENLSTDFSVVGRWILEAWMFP